MIRYAVLGLVVAGVALGVVLGLCLAGWAERHLERRNEIAYRALRAVHNENAGLSSQTRAIVIDALAQHEVRR